MSHSSAPLVSRRARPASALARLGVGAVVTLALAAAAGCGVQSDSTADAQGGDAEASVPTLPPVDERLPGAYDEDGCLILTEGRDCGAPAEAVDDALAGDESARTVRGFQGPLFVTDVSADVVAVLEETVSIAPSGAWSATGLLRNETTSPVLAPTITATLLGADGAVVDEVEGSVLVAPVRPGEPAPFTVESDVDATAVASVTWAVSDAGGDAPAGTRDLELATYFVEPAGQRDPLGLYLYDETGPGPHPYVLFGSVTDLADIDATNPTVVAAWLDADGRVRALTESAAVDSAGDPVEALRPDGLADFLLTVDAGVGAGLDAAPLLLWAVSR